MADNKFLNCYLLPTGQGRGTLSDKKNTFPWKFYPVLWITFFVNFGNILKNK